MKNVKFILAVHNHQPVGNFGNVSEEAFRLAYLPFIEVMREYPWFRFNLHYTGPLLEWLASERPSFMAMLREMAESGQVEFLTGGYYEPITALLPERDKLGQIAKLSGYIKKNFGQTPSGMWLAERVWEPHLPGPLKRAGVDHVVVDDFHFRMSGLRGEELTGYFHTDELYDSVKVFPGSERLRYTMPFRLPAETIDYFRGLPEADGGALAVMADDGEKFGVWPGTHKWCYDEGWLRSFVEAVYANRDWLTPTTFGEYAAGAPSRGTVYLPTCSYMEMGEWSLPASVTAGYERFLEELKNGPDYDERRAFVKGGMFRNFLSKYPESGAMHKRMLGVSAAVDRCSGLMAAGAASRMRDELWMSQCNDAYWHGVFGGLYLPHLRDAVYRHIINAETAAESAEAERKGAKDGWLKVETADFDGDLAPEIKVSNRHVALIADPGMGGSLYELDYRPVSMNFMNTLTRRKEAYHDKLAGAVCAGDGPAKTIHEGIASKEDGLCELLHYDWYRRASLIDHFLGADVDLMSFRSASYHEAGNLVQGHYVHSVKKTRDRVTLEMTGMGAVMGSPVTVTKTLTVGRRQEGFDVRYSVTNDGAEELNAAFGVEFNLSLLAGNAHDRYFTVPGHVLASPNFASDGELNNVSEVKMTDDWLGYVMSVSWGSPATLWRFPVETVSQSEAGFERVYQCSSLMPLWRLSLKPGGSWETVIKAGFSHR